MNLYESLVPDDDEDSFLFRENLFLALNFLKVSDILILNDLFTIFF